MPTSEKSRRMILQRYARQQLTRLNKCQALINITALAAALVDGMNNKPYHMLEDLKFVLIGGNLRSLRGKGDRFAGNHAGSIGFKPKLRDPYNQVQHAMAGIYIGYKWGYLGEWGARWLETEPQDDLLYKATCKLGRQLRDFPHKYKSLPLMIRQEVCDGSCVPPAKPFPAAPGI